MPQRRVTVTESAGLHARPAGLFTRAAAQSGHTITVGRDGAEPVNAASILALMSLGIAYGEEIVISSDADEATEVLDALAALVSESADAPV